jgi:hypothetical protein
VEPVRQNLEDLLYYSVLGVIIGIAITLMIVYFGGFTSGSIVDDSSFYYQDLNKVEIKAGKYPIDPRVVEAIHHFQKYPFGKLMDGEDYRITSRMFNSIHRTLIDIYYKMVCFLVFLFVCFCLFSYCS